MNVERCGRTNYHDGRFTHREIRIPTQPVSSLGLGCDRWLLIHNPCGLAFSSNTDHPARACPPDRPRGSRERGHVIICLQVHLGWPVWCQLQGRQLSIRLIQMAVRLIQMVVRLIHMAVRGGCEHFVTARVGRGIQYLCLRDWLWQSSLDVTPVYRLSVVFSGCYGVCVHTKVI